jgi:hypothetical protein
MKMIPSIGSWVWGQSGDICQVHKVQQHPRTKAVRLVVICPQGQIVIPLEAFKGMALDKTDDYPAVGDRVWVALIDVVGIVAQLDHEYREARVQDIEGYIHPMTGYQVISQWFPFGCLETLEAQRETA